MFAIAIHGGAGTLLKEKMTPEKEQVAFAALRGALYAGYQLLKKGGNSLDAVQAAVQFMEDVTIFNAGKGSVFTNKGDHEMDASIMCGQTHRAGAISAVKHIKNPIDLARHILDKSEYIFLTGEGAEEYAFQEGIAMVPNNYFSTQFRKNQFKLAQEANVVALDHSDDKFGTVGAVALDVKGNLAAATSTGGLTNKVFGRVGDSPIIGAGTYASNATCAVSCTGKGEFFIKNVVAHNISCLMEYKGLTLQEACEAIMGKFDISSGGSGGFIAVDKHGKINLTFNTQGMYRGYIHSDDEDFHVGIYRDDIQSFQTV